MQANQTQIPTIQTPDNAQNQIQQNINKVLRNLNNQIVTNTNDISNLEIIGEIKFSSLTLSQFQDQAGSNWILANGQSSVGSAYQQLTGNKTVPTVSVSGTTAFIKVN